MAKKNKNVDNMEESGGSKAVTALIAIIIILIWLAVFAFLIKLDVGGGWQQCTLSGAERCAGHQ